MIHRPVTRSSVVVALFGVAAILASPVALLAQALEVVNHQPFPIRMPWLVRGMKVAADAPAQQVGDGAVVLVDVPAAGTARPLEVGLPESRSTPAVAPRDGGLHLKLGEADLGQLAWGVVLRKLDQRSTDATAADTMRHHDGEFWQLPLTFARTGGGPLFQTWSAEGSQDGLKLAVRIDVYRHGFIDLHQVLTSDAPRANVYAAVVARWQQPGATERTVSYDGRVTKLADGAATPFRKGEGRHHFIQRGADWTCARFASASVAWLHDFAPSFTYHRGETARAPARWVGANSAQLGQEAIRRGDALLSVTEIARPNLRMYQPRLQDNVLPGPDQPVAFSSRMILAGGAGGAGGADGARAITDDRADQMFVAYTGYNAQEKLKEATTRLRFGVPHVRFGTAYFPYSTLGENFEKWHMPGQSKETYWPLSADTVTNYTLFADDIRRDLRIAKAMGFQSVRLHHLELIAALPRDVQDAYLDFFFAELKHLGLTALLDVKLPPARVAELVERYRPQVDGVEVDNEVLIFGIDDRDVEGWKQIYAAVKAVAPDMPVWWTAHTNTGAFERMRKLDVPFDRVGAHAYLDSLDAIPSGRGYALAVADYASEVGRPPIITEWNWRFLTRMTPEDRAKVYPPIFENVLKTRCVPVFYQFQFQESLAMATRSLRGIRHYEQLNLSRRPRPEAFEMMKLIRTYGDPAAPQNVLRTEYQAVEVREGQPLRVKVSVTNASDKPRKIFATAEGPAGVELVLQGDPTPRSGAEATLQRDARTLDLAPGATGTALLDVTVAPDALPGF
ncbi:MAG TPA: hypothetical protein VER17_02915 [Tepidisphaeraceae bacterium]|nr:hypothetical protein [Tepidisphaeraceae bacterium]